MLILAQLITVLVMFGITYVIFLAFGARRMTLLYTKEEKEQWDRVVAQPLGSWFTATNILGTLTSLATVYLFFIGNSKLFGGWVFICAATIWGGAFVTNYVTKKVSSDPYIQELLASPDQVGGVIATVFWRSDTHSIQTAALVRVVSLCNIAGVIWLEFALFADISATLLGAQGMAWRLALLVIACFTVFYFTLKYGLRGFVFADLFQSPMIGLGSALLLGGSLWLFVSSPNITPLPALFRPILPLRDCILFALHVVALNLLLVVVTEPHWLRLWLFREKETRLQAGSLTATALLWSVLIVVGLIASFLAGGQFGEKTVLELLNSLSKLSPGFIVAFWIAAVAALFSTADSQIYSFLLVRQYDSASGKLRSRPMGTIRPLRSAIISAVGLAVVYFVVRKLELPLEKIVFIVIPMSLNLLPAFVRAVLRRPQRSGFLWASLILYVACSVLGFMQPAQQFTWTLCAALAPVLVSIAAGVGNSHYEVSKR